MGKFDETLDTYKAEMKKLGISVDEDLLAKVAKGLGPNIYLADASTVASSDPDELERVKENFLMKKLGLEDGPELDAAISKVIDAFGSAHRNKYRAIFYAMLVEHFNKQSVYN